MLFRAVGAVIVPAASICHGGAPGCLHSKDQESGPWDRHRRSRNGTSPLRSRGAGSRTPGCFEHREEQAPTAILSQRPSGLRCPETRGAIGVVLSELVAGRQSSHSARRPWVCPGRWPEVTARIRITDISTTAHGRPYRRLPACCCRDNDAGRMPARRRHADLAS